MSSIVIKKFGGMRPSVDPRQLEEHEAQVAHNCLLTDGSLRPMPLWQQIGGDIQSITAGRSNTPYTTVGGYCGIAFNGPPFGVTTIYLDQAGVLWPLATCSATGSVSVTGAGLSKKPVNRVYGVTAVQVIGGAAFESAMSMVSTDVQAMMFEGDIADMTVSGTNATFLNIYRSTSDVTTGAAANGAITANWQLLAQLPGAGGQFIDGGSAVANPFDTYLYRGPLAPPFLARYMGLLESGYVWLLSPDGQIALSDRFGWAIWPAENIYNLTSQPGSSAIQVNSAVSVGDALYIGTKLGVYYAQAKVTDSGSVVLSIVPIAGSYPPLPNTMAATPSGAIYTSAQGVVAVQENRVIMLTKDMARGSAGTLPDGTEVLFNTIGNAIYHNGRYYAIADGD